MSDRRSVATDALDTLGTAPLDDTAKRDAIHLAVVPVIAGERLSPGSHITSIDGVALSADPGDDEPPLGIVDPFLPCAVKKGQRFWLVIYPRTITSLRHVWSHPAFADESGVNAPATESAVRAWSKADSETWLREFCDRSNSPDYECLMEAIGDGSDVGEHSLCVGREASGDIPPVFWTHVEIVLGRKVDNHPTYFSCAC